MRPVVRDGTPPFIDAPLMSLQTLRSHERWYAQGEKLTLHNFVGHAPEQMPRSGVLDDARRCLPRRKQVVHLCATANATCKLSMSSDLSFYQDVDLHPCTGSEALSPHVVPEPCLQASQNFLKLPRQDGGRRLVVPGRPTWHRCANSPRAQVGRCPADTHSNRFRCLLIDVLSSLRRQEDNRVAALGLAHVRSHQRRM